MSHNKKKLVAIAIAFFALATAGPGACNSTENTVGGPVGLGGNTVSTPTADEVEFYWERENAKEKIRQEAIRRDAVVAEWRGDWDPDAKLALFRGQGHVSDVRVGSQYMDLVERDQIVLKEYKDGAWFAVSNISNNLQPGGKAVFVR